MNRKIKKETRQLIKELRISGQTDTEIYNQLTGEYHDDSIARLIAITIKPKDKKKHCLYIGILLGITAVIVLFNIWIIRNSRFSFFDIDFSSIYRFITGLWGYVGTSYMFAYAIILSNICKKQITSYIFWMYTCSFLIFYFLINVFIELTFEGGIYWLYLAINLLSISLIIFLARFFQRKIFPNYRYWKLKRDEDREYVFVE